MRPSKQLGFTLIEVLAAVLIVSLVFGLLLESVTRNLKDLSRARAETRSAELAEDKIAELRAELETGEKLDDGVTEGVFNSPDDDMHWQVGVVPQKLALPADYKGEVPPSPLFSAANEPPQKLAPGQEPPLRLIEVRVFAKDVDPASVDPFVILLTTPPDPARMQQVQQQQATDPNGAAKATSGGTPSQTTQPQTPAMGGQTGQPQ
ncbi:MAG: prepilin-type N-terminal cleavage/methylation domain-containing protein [Myxococcota bacterium]